MSQFVLCSAFLVLSMFFSFFLSYSFLLSLSFFLSFGFLCRFSLVSFFLLPVLKNKQTKNKNKKPTGFWHEDQGALQLPRPTLRQGCTWYNYCYRCLPDQFTITETRTDLWCQTKRKENSSFASLKVSRRQKSCVKFHPHRSIQELPTSMVPEKWVSNFREMAFYWGALSSIRIHRTVENVYFWCELNNLFLRGSCGATVARLTPDQKVACSNHVRVINIFFFFFHFLNIF